MDNRNVSLPNVNFAGPGPRSAGMQSPQNTGAQNPQGAGQFNMNVTGITPENRPMVQRVNVAPKQEKSHSGLIMIIVIIVLSMLAVTFIGLFIWMKTEYDEINDNVQDQIDAAVAVAKDEQASKDEAEFLEREKYPYKTFAGPVDYGQLIFQYPKTWSVYVAEAAEKGGDFNAYFNPVQVDAVGKDTINALRVTIRDKSFEDVTAEYQRQVEQKDAKLTVESIMVHDTQANRYTGTIPSTDLSGIIVIFKIRDKTVIMQTDNMLFKDDFDKLLETVTFNA